MLQLNSKIRFSQTLISHYSDSIYQISKITITRKQSIISPKKKEKKVRIILTHTQIIKLIGSKNKSEVQEKELNET